MALTRYKIIIEYDGTTFCGWQKQAGNNSVQEQIEKAIFAFSHKKVDVMGSGRTDAGVHALGQVANFDLDMSDDYDSYRIMGAINHYLKVFAQTRADEWIKQMESSKDSQNYNIRIKHDFNLQPIAILSCEKVGNDFEARFSADKRYYRYIILNQKYPTALSQNRVWHVREPLDIEKMKLGASYLIGKHDFTSFRDSECQAKSPIKTLDKINIFQNQSNKNEIIFELTAKSFLHHMVRNIVGTLKDVGDGTTKPEKVKEILEGKNRSLAGQTCPACGLYFVGVEYK